METMKQIVLQEMNEQRYNRKHIDTKIRAAIEGNPGMVAKLNHGVELVKGYMSKTYSYTTKDGQTKVFESKMRRIAQLENLDVPTMVIDIFVGIAYCLNPELFTSVSAQIAARLKFSDRTEAITTVAELMAVLCLTDAFDITKADRSASLMIESKVPLSPQLVDFIKSSQYLPPMVCEPLELTHNYSSGYLTHNDSLILGSGNHHDGDICLDVLNTMNQVALKLDTHFLCTVEEEPTFELDNQEKTDQWNTFKRQSYEFYDLMVSQGNHFYLTHKVDKRGRIYACGYHINTQGTAFKKASIELAHEEIVTGTP